MHGIASAVFCIDKIIYLTNLVKPIEYIKKGMGIYTQIFKTFVSEKLIPKLKSNKSNQE